MNKRIKKKYKPIFELWEFLEWVTLRLNRHNTLLDSLKSRLNTLEDIESTNIQTINRKFEEYDKRIELLEKEIKQLKKPFWKR
ncbi:hypothetical protein ACQRD4_00485 [Streptococcus hyointestinalis]|uniref:hypothetical protein n=1 Tax=Streptococcus TaxID=1301 RepID=UPI003CFD4DCC